MSKSTRGAHRAPTTRRWPGRRSRPACGPVPQLPEPLPFTGYDESAALAEAALDRPSMDLPEGHMARRPETDQAPGPVYVGTLLPTRASSYRVDDVVVVVAGLHVDRRGIVESAYGSGHLKVDIDGSTVYLHEDEVDLVRRPSGDAESFGNVHVAVPVALVAAEHAVGTPVGYWLPDGAEVADTLVLDDMALMGGASR